MGESTVLRFGQSVAICRRRPERNLCRSQRGCDIAAAPWIHTAGRTFALEHSEVLRALRLSAALPPSCNSTTHPELTVHSCTQEPLLHLPACEAAVEHSQHCHRDCCRRTQAPPQPTRSLTVAVGRAGGAIGLGGASRTNPIPGLAVIGGARRCVVGHTRAEGATPCRARGASAAVVGLQYSTARACLRGSMWVVVV